MQDDVQEQLEVIYEALDTDVMSDAVQLRIAETIVRLPEDIRDFARSHITWRVFEPTWRSATRTPFWVLHPDRF